MRVRIHIMLGVGRSALLRATIAGGSIVLAAAAAYMVVLRRRRRLAGTASSRPLGPNTCGCVEPQQPAAAAATCEEPKRGRSTTVVPPTMSPTYNLEYSIHRPSRLLRQDIHIVFRPDLEAEHASDPRGAAAGLSLDEFLARYLLAVPTWQPAQQDLSEISNIVNEERRALLANFDAWAEAVRPRLQPQWSDVSCPMEGNARYGTPTSSIYNELEGLTSLLRYDSMPIGCCGIVLHPHWQRRAYPVTLFTTAPVEVVKRVFVDVEAEAGERGRVKP